MGKEKKKHKHLDIQKKAVSHQPIHSSTHQPIYSFTHSQSPNSIIRVHNLGKKYRIGGPVGRFRYKTLRDTLMDVPKALIKRLCGGHAYQDETIWALKNVSFEVEQGEVVGIIGRNGAGKTTLLKVLSRITEPTEGKVELRGRVGSLLEVGTGFHPELTGRENIYLNGAILGMKRSEIKRKFDEIVAFAEIEKFIDTPVKRYSSGMYVRLAFSVAAHLEPEILLVDEVLSVGDAAFQKKCLGKMGEVAKGGRTVLFVSHNMGAIKALCQWSIQLDNGQICQTGPTQKVVNRYMSHIYERVQSRKDVFPIFNPLYGMGIARCDVTVGHDDNGVFILKVELDVKSIKTTHNIGVGLALSCVDGTKVSILGPSVTNFLIPEINGHRRCTFHCKEIDKYLAGGDYLLSVWLSIPRFEYIVKVDEAALFTIPSRDVFLSGELFQALKHGFVPLPLQFTVQ